jgi:hypothetical protein
MGCALQRMLGICGKRLSESWSLTALRKVNRLGARRWPMLRGVDVARGKREAASAGDAW